MDATAHPEHLESAATSPQSLQSSLHAATRTLHTQLNTSIIKRLPQCLPPHASDPTAYHLGLLAFGQIFVAFEKGIANVLLEHAPGLEAERARQVQSLETLHTTGLARAPRLKHDGDTLSLRLFSAKTVNAADVLRRVEGKVRSDVDIRTRQTTERIQRKPYLAFAYTWTMYLALFNGGRHIYRALRRPGRDFWLEDERETGSEKSHALTFWDFDVATEEDPEADQLKFEFKRRFDEASQQLTVSERDEIIQEAIGIFELCVELVGYLDGVMAEVAREAAQVVASPDLSRPSSESKTWSGVTTSILAPFNQLLNLGWKRPLVEEIKD